MPKVSGPSNIEKRMLARRLWKTQKPIYRDVSKRLMAPARNRVEKNLGDLNRITNDGDVIVVPGKILGDGTLSKSITIACYAISKSAVKKLEASNTKRMTIDELVEKYPEGKGVRIII
jgi:large subunit ribosomal protein L18e